MPRRQDASHPAAFAGGAAVRNHDDHPRPDDPTREEAAATLAGPGHPPETVAAAMGLAPGGAAEGRPAFRRMVLDDLQAACRRGDAQAAARLGLLLHHLLGDDAAQADAAAADTGRLARALGIDPRAPRWEWVRERLDVYMAAMLRHFGLDPALLRERLPSRMHIAELCCASCAGTARCRGFLASDRPAEAPEEFCPNARLFKELARRGLPGADLAGSNPPPG
jgi:hypothetical protein